MTLTCSDLDLILFYLSDEIHFPSSAALSSSFSTVWIASGLAKISAAYGSSLVERNIGTPSKYMTALEYCQKSNVSSLPILISLMGRHEDSIGVARSISARPIISSIFVTGDASGHASQALKAGSHFTEIVTAQLPNRDQRFVNCNSIFMLTALVHRLVENAYKNKIGKLLNPKILREVFNKAATISKSWVDQIINLPDWHNRQLVILSDGLISELSITWQSILAESGVFTATLGDIKDYTHGDHLAAVRSANAIYIVLQHPEIEEVCNIFISRFSTRFPVVLIDIDTSGVERFWANLFCCCNVTDGLSRELGYRGKRPPKDCEVHSWRGWGKVDNKK